MRRAARGSSRACPGPWPPRRGRPRIRGRSPPWLARRFLRLLAIAAEGREVDLGERLVDQPPVVLVGERFAGDLLGGEHGEVGDLLPDSLERAPGLRLDVAGGGQQLLALFPALLGRLSLRRIGRLARPGDDVVRLLAGLLQPGAVLLEDLVRFVAGLLGVLDRLADRAGALVERLLDPREGELAQHPHREQEDEQSPDHQTEIRRDQEAAALLLLCGLGDQWYQRRQLGYEIHPRGLEEERDQTEDERVEGDGLGKREPEPANRLEVVLHLRLAGDGLDLLAEDDADADACPDRAETRTHAERNRLAGVGDPGVRDALSSLGDRNQHINHESTLL